MWKKKLNLITFKNLIFLSCSFLPLKGQGFDCVSCLFTDPVSEQTILGPTTYRQIQNTEIIAQSYSLNPSFSQELLDQPNKIQSGFFPRSTQNTYSYINFPDTNFSTVKLSENSPTPKNFWNGFKLESIPSQPESAPTSFTPAQVFSLPPLPVYTPYWLTEAAFTASR